MLRKVLQESGEISCPVEHILVLECMGPVRGGVMLNPACNTGSRAPYWYLYCTKIEGFSLGAEKAFFGC